MKSSRLTARAAVSILAVIFITVLVQGTAESQDYMKKPIEHPRIVLAEKLQTTKDYFGRQRFIGKVRNMEKARIDYIKIEFTLWNREGELIETVSHFIRGKRHQFHDFQISTSSLEPNQTGTFDIITSTPADSVFTYKHSITGTHFIYK